MLLIYSSLNQLRSQCRPNSKQVGTWLFFLFGSNENTTQMKKFTVDTSLILVNMCLFWIEVSNRSKRSRGSSNKRECGLQATARSLVISPSAAHNMTQRIWFLISQTCEVQIIYQQCVTSPHFKEVWKNMDAVSFRLKRTRPTQIVMKAQKQWYRGHGSAHGTDNLHICDWTVNAEKVLDRPSVPFKDVLAYSSMTTARHKLCAWSPVRQERDRGTLSKHLVSEWKGDVTLCEHAAVARFWHFNCIQLHSG